jgi:hypothetical protein
MKKLLITLILISPFSFADWGDVYYCQMTNFSAVSLEGKRKDYTLEKFQFKLDKTKKAMVFGSSGYFKTTEAKLTPDRHWPALESWYAYDTYDVYYFDEGKFLFVSTSSSGSYSVSADCDKF